MITLYAARDKKTRKFVNDLTNPRHKFWEQRGFCEKAIRNFNSYAAFRRQRSGEEPRYDLELVELKCFTPEELNE